jgi:NAD(P)-dependent dehydrogenase (short-subunit alcohol dehydrogenase family)
MSQRIAVVTGGNKGLGFEICRQLAQSGVNVVLTARDEARGLRAVQTLQAQRLNAIFHPLDVTDDDSVRTLREYMARTHGRCDILVNNAGISLRGSGRSVLTTALRDFDVTLDTNFYGPLRLCQALVPLMQKHRYGRVVNLSSDGSARRHAGRLGCVPRVEGGAECAHAHGVECDRWRGRPGEQRVPGMGSHRYGRPERISRREQRRRDRCVARDLTRRWAERWVFPGS